MIRLVQGSQRARFPHEIDQMHRLRAQVFYERLGWDVKVRHSREIDQFDSLDPLYLLSLDDRGHVQGSLRLLPTTGPHMLADVFSALLPVGQTVRSATVWESSRFSVAQSAVAERSSNLLNRVTGELLLGIVEVGMMAGLTEVVSVYDLCFSRILKRAKCYAEPIGAPARIGKVTAFAGLFEISETMIENLRQASGIKESVLEPPTLTRLAA
jgi:N-acyl-L-homoserine lactone synthetase